MMIHVKCWIRKYAKEKNIALELVHNLKYRQKQTTAQKAQNGPGQGP